MKPFAIQTSKAPVVGLVPGLALVWVPVLGPVLVPVLVLVWVPELEPELELGLELLESRLPVKALLPALASG